MKTFALCFGLSVGGAIGYAIHPSTPEAHPITVYENNGRTGPVTHLIARPCASTDSYGRTQYYLEPRTCDVCLQAHAEEH